MAYLNTDCPYCGSESAYHNDVELECLVCVETWDEDVELDDDDNQLYWIETCYL